MRSLAVNGYTAAEVAVELARSGRRVGFRHELVSVDGEILGDLGTVESCTIEHNALADVHRTAKIVGVDDPDVDYLSDRIRPHYRLTMPDGGVAEWPLGLFLLSSPARRVGTARTTREIEAYDLGLALEEDRVVDRYVIASGTVVTDAIRTVLDAAGIVDRYVTTSDETLPTARDWPPGTSRRKIVNELLSSINYSPLWFDAAGFAVAKPYQRPSDRPTGHTYATDDRSLILPGLDHELDLFGIANRWVATVSEPDRAPLRSTYINDNPDSPTSTVSRGRTIVDHRTSEATSQAALDAYVERLAFEASQVYEIVELETATMPHHAFADVIRLEHDTADLDARYTEHTWSLDLKVGGKMSHRIRRVVTV